MSIVEPKRQLATRPAKFPDHVGALVNQMVGHKTTVWKIEADELHKHLAERWEDKVADQLQSEEAPSTTICFEFDVEKDFRFEEYSPTVEEVGEALPHELRIFLEQESVYVEALNELDEHRRGKAFKVVLEIGDWVDTQFDVEAVAAEWRRETAAWAKYNEGGKAHRHFHVKDIKAFPVVQQDAEQWKAYMESHEEKNASDANRILFMFFQGFVSVLNAERARRIAVGHVGPVGVQQIDDYLHARFEWRAKMQNMTPEDFKDVMGKTYVLTQSRTVLPQQSYDAFKAFDTYLRLRSANKLGASASAKRKRDDQ